MSTTHVDEASGSDEIGKGTQELPFKSLAFAVYSSGGLSNIKYLIRKDPTTDYDEATQSALKKAKKGADGIEKKRKKAEELAAREDSEKKAERERKEKLLEESKRIVLQEDPALPKAVKVRWSCYISLELRCLVDGSHVDEDWQRCSPQGREDTRFRVGSSSTIAEGYHLHSPARWYGVPPIRFVRSRREHNYRSSCLVLVMLTLTGRLKHTMRSRSHLNRPPNLWEL